VLEAKRHQLLVSMEKRYGQKLKKIAGRDVLFEGSDGTRRACLVVSKRYDGHGMEYWYAYHQAWHEFLTGGEQGYYVLGCLEEASAFAIPKDVMAGHLHLLNTSEPAGRPKYWHIKLKKDATGNLALELPLSGDLLSLDSYRFALPPSDTAVATVT
jgi:hypothetical protein